ncbi:hypothetical protein DES41_111199 [Pseudorhodoferax soli]|uniref:Uncharacterized protein n=2 Tax=Pseudorhodoferax soli TaxID=545864 RepID=A0A368XE41_9BURK|nr:hypothetical protein DES41_111199 [Pseudorhodoferax soli]
MGVGAFNFLENTMQMQPWNEEQRKLFHVEFNDWINTAEEADFDRLETLRAEVAPGEVCSMVRLVRSCFARPDLLAGLPTALVQRLREQSLLQLCAVSPSHAGAQ